MSHVYSGLMPVVGAHVDRHDPLAAAAELGIDAVQIFLGDPQGWGKPDFAAHQAEGAEGFRAAARAAGVSVYVHAPYIINVASPNNRIRVPSRRLLASTVAAAAEIGAAGVVVHGGHVTGDIDDEVGFDNWRKAVEQLDMACPVLIENTAGGRHAMARTLSAWGRLWDAVGDSGVGVCFDTCHAWAAGIDLPSEVAAFRAITGRIDLVHANDSRGAFGSGQDRHANFGEGTIGESRLLDAIADTGAPAVICETPNAGVAADLDAIRGRLGLSS